MAPRHAADQLGEANVDALHDDDDGNVVFGVAPKGPFINYIDNYDCLCTAFSSLLSGQMKTLD